MLLILYRLAIYNKKEVSKHMRYMIGVALVFLDPTLEELAFITRLSMKFECEPA